MKKIFCIVLAACLLMLGACAKTIPQTDLVYGIYCPEESVQTYPKLYLKESGEFTFSYEGFGGSSERGTYSVEGDLLKLDCEDSDEVFVFEINKDYLTFDADSSSPIVQQEGTTPIVDGTKFLIRHEVDAK